MFWRWNHGSSYMELTLDQTVSCDWFLPRTSLWELAGSTSSCQPSSIPIHVCGRQWSRNREVTMSRLIGAPVALSDSKQSQRKLSRELAHRISCSRPLVEDSTLGRMTMFKWLFRDRYESVENVVSFKSGTCRCQLFFASHNSNTNTYAINWWSILKF